MTGNNVVGTLRGELLGEAWTATLTYDGWQTDNDFMSVALESYTNEIYKELIDPMDQRAWGVGVLLQAAEDFNATAELNPMVTRDRQSEALQPIAYHSRINPVLPPPRRPLRYGWEMTRELDDGRKRWKGTEEDKGKYRTQKIKPGTRVKSSGDNRRSIGEHIDTLLESPERFTTEHRDDLRNKLLTLTRDQFATLRSQFGIRKKGRRKEDEINTLLKGVEERKKPDPRAGRTREGLGGAKVPEKRKESLTTEGQERKVSLTPQPGNSPAGGQGEKKMDAASDYKEEFKNARAEAKKQLGLIFGISPSGSKIGKTPTTVNLAVGGGDTPSTMFERKPKSMTKVRGNTYEITPYESGSGPYAYRDGMVVDVDGQPMVVARAGKLVNNAVRDDEGGVLTRRASQQVTLAKPTPVQAAEIRTLRASMKFNRAYLGLAGENAWAANAEDAQKRISDYAAAKAEYEAAKSEFEALHPDLASKVQE